MSEKNICHLFHFTKPVNNSWLPRDIIIVLKSKTKETPKFLSSSGTKGAKSISVYNFSAQQLASSGNQRIFNFRVVVVRDINLLTRLSKYRYIYLSYSEVKVLGKALV